MAPLPANEAQRLDALRQAQLLDTLPEAAFDDLTRLAAHICGVPIAAVSLIDADRQWFKSILGLETRETPLTEDQKAALQLLARQAAGQIELAQRVAAQERLIAERTAAEETLRQSQTRLLEAQRVAKIGSWEYDVATSRVAWSPEMFRVLGFDPADGEPNHETLLTHYDPEDVTLHDRMLLQVLEDGLPYEYDIRILESQKLVRWGHIVGQAMRDESGRIVRLLGTLMDITERKQAEEENARLAAIIEHSTDAVLGLTLGGAIVSWNKSAERLFGYSEGEIIGQHFSVLTEQGHAGVAASVVQALKQGEQRSGLEMRGRRRDGTYVEMVQTFSPIRNQTGKIVGVAASGHDVTEQRRAEDAVRRSEARLAEAQRVAHIGSWELDARTTELVFSEEMFHLFELDPAAGVPPHEVLLTRYHSSDVAAHTALVAQALADGKPFVTDIRIVRQNGEIRWVHIIGEPVFDDAGNLLRLVGTTMDVTERMRTEERFRVLFKHSSEAHFLATREGIVDCNQAALDMLRCSSKAEVMSLPPYLRSPQYQPDGQLSAEKGRDMAAAAYKNGVCRSEWLLTRMDGEEFPSEVILTPVTLDEKPAMLAVWHDLTERKRAEQRIHDYAVMLEVQKQELEQANRELCDLATTDGLTGLKNHRAFQERLLAECETAERHQTALSLLMLDVDNFKQFNDTFGHPAGDAVLKQVAHLLAHTMRECDFVARYGGEEFVVVLPHTDQAGALRAAERCRMTIENAEWDCRAVTASFGVATLSLDCAGSAALVAAADQALYAAKSGGRNRVMHARSFRLPLSAACEVQGRAF